MRGYELSTRVDPDSGGNVVWQLRFPPGSSETLVAISTKCLSEESRMLISPPSMYFLDAFDESEHDHGRHEAY